MEKFFENELKIYIAIISYLYQLEVVLLNTNIPILQNIINYIKYIYTKL